MNMRIESYSKTTKETGAQRIQELEKFIGYMGGIIAPGARAIAQLIATLEVRVTDLEARLTVAEQVGKNTTADPPRTRR